MSLRDLIMSEKYKEQFAAALPKFLTPERFVRVALTALTKTPKLQKCKPATVMACLFDCARLGIEPDERRAYLIPYGDVCTLIIGYQGFIDLARRSGEVAIWRAELVCDEDAFVYGKGEVQKHDINFRKPRGDVYAVYSYVRFKDGAEDYEVMSSDEVEAIRKRSKAGTNGPWVTDWREMAKKTVIRRHAKRMPLSAEFRDAVDKDADTVIDVDKNSYEVHDGKSRTQQIAEKLAGSIPAPAASPSESVEAERQVEPEPRPEPAGKFALCGECDGELVSYSDEESDAIYKCSKCGLLYNAKGEVCGALAYAAEPEPEEPKPMPPPVQKPKPATPPSECPACGKALSTLNAPAGYLLCSACGSMFPEKRGTK